MHIPRFVGVLRHLRKQLEIGVLERNETQQFVCWKEQHHDLTRGIGFLVSYRA
jgi:hypothetical protein